MSLALVGMGTAVPDHHGDQALALGIARDMCAQTERQDRLLRAIYRRSGVSKRHSVLRELSEGPRGGECLFDLPGAAAVAAVRRRRYECGATCGRYPRWPSVQPKVRYTNPESGQGS